MAESTSSSPGGLKRWARFTTRHPWQVIGGWIAIAMVLALLAGTVGGSFADRFAIPGSESQQALDTLRAEFPAYAGDSAQIVFHSDTDIRSDTAIQERITAFVEQAATLPEVTYVASPLDPSTPTISADGTIAYATVLYDKQSAEIDPASIDQLEALVHATAGPGLETIAGGSVIQELPETGTSELIGIVAAIIILLVAFGSIIAMGLPIVTAIAGVGISMLLTIVLANVIDFSSITTALVSMIGLGVGIDYALFIINRFREEQELGTPIEDAVVRATDTAGRAVLFAGSLVIVALLGLFVIGIPFIGLVGLGGAIAVFVSMLVAVGLMPPLLRLLGPSLERWTIHKSVHKPVDQTFGWKNTERIQKHPAVWLVGALLLAAVLAWPALSGAQLGTADSGTAPAGSDARVAYDLIAEGFGPGSNGPLLLVIDSDDDRQLSIDSLNALSSAIAETPNVAAVAPAALNPAGTTAVMTVIPLSAPQDTATEDLIDTLRNDVVPAALGDQALDASIGGATATFIDLATATSERMPYFIILVAGLSVLILMMVFRSVLVPIKAAAATLLSFAVGFGIMVAIFQEGAFGLNELIGADRTGPIESFLPIILFAILFGLSMDYEIFLVSRVHEAWLHRQDNGWALRHGLGASGRVVLAAGAIMASVFLSFALGDQRTIKELGIGLGAAILFDALVVRMFIVPAFMSLAGTWNWWLPAWLDRVLPKLNVDGEPNEHEFDEDDQMLEQLTAMPAD
ncbi:MAG: MMPL family transporter [Thermomicrobiales bacterium]